VLREMRPAGNAAPRPQAATPVKASPHVVPRVVDDDRRSGPQAVAGAPVPRSLGGYKITATLASGAMGVVYRGEHPSWRRRRVAIKALHQRLQHDPAIVGRFFGESVATARVNHPNVIRFYDFGYDASGAAYLVLELLEGETLSARLGRERALGMGVALDIACQVCEGLQAAHQQGVIHRDLKPDNIFLCVDPQRPHNVKVKLIDFGVAKVHGQGPTQTLDGDLLGTPAYMAPEQGRSAAESDARSDIYALGCILFEMLCGVVPFPGSIVEVLVAHQTGERPPARALNPKIPPAVDALLDRMLARDPAARAQSAAEVLVALREIQSKIGASGLSPRAGTIVVRPDFDIQRILERFLEPRVLSFVGGALFAILVVVLLMRC